MYPTNEVRFAAIVERHQQRASLRRAISVARAPRPVRIGRWITLEAHEVAAARPVRPAA